MDQLFIYEWKGSLAKGGDVIYEKYLIIENFACHKLQADHVIALVSTM